MFILEPLVLEPFALGGAVRSGAVMFAALVMAALGILAGGGARLLIGRLRRGAVVAPPWCELAVAALWSACGGAWVAGRLPGQWLPLLLGLAWLGVAAGAVDIARRRLPDLLTLPAFPLVVVLAGPLGPAAVGRAGLAAAVLFGAHLLVRMALPGALGAGDVKLAAAVGAALGTVSWAALAVGVVLAAFLTAVVAVGGLVAGRAGLAGRVPHGPAMLGAGWLVVANAALGAGTAAWSA